MARISSDEFEKFRLNTSICANRDVLPLWPLLTSAFLIEDEFCADALSPTDHNKAIENSHRFHEKRTHLERVSKGKTLGKGATSHQCEQLKRN